MAYGRPFTTVTTGVLHNHANVTKERAWLAVKIIASWKLMKNKSLLNHNPSLKGQKFTVIFKKQEYVVRVLGGVAQEDSRKIKVLIDGVQKELLQTDDRWRFSEENANPAFAAALKDAILSRSSA